MEFLSTWQFWLGIFIGAILGYFTAALCAVSSRASREEERMERDVRLDDQFIKLLEEAKRLNIGSTGFIERTLKKYKLIPRTEIATKGKPEDA